MMQLVGVMTKYALDEAKNAVSGTSRVAEALAHVFEHATEDDPESVLEQLDEFSATKQMLINVGKEKGEFLDQIIKDANPKIALELGAFVGYSAVRIARLLPEDGKLISIEKSPLFAAIATKIAEFAGLQSKVKFVVGKSTDIIPKLREKYGIEKIDFVFLDHGKGRYLSDLKLIESENLLKKGSIITADNIIVPGGEKIQKYLDYVRNEPKYKSSLSKAVVQSMNGLEDGVEVSVVLEDF